MGLLDSSNMLGLNGSLVHVFIVAGNPGGSRVSRTMDVPGARVQTVQTRLRRGFPDSLPGAARADPQHNNKQIIPIYFKHYAPTPSALSPPLRKC